MRPSDPHPIAAQGLAKSFGSVRAVRHVDLDVAPGAALGLLGPNGSGKSTTLSMLMGLRRPDAGHIQIFGHAAGSAPARALTGATPQSAGFPEQLTPRELLSYTAARYGVAPRIDALTEDFGLSALLDRRVAGFSGGEMRKVALALAFVGDPKLVFLDEPTTGLDSDAQDHFREVAREYVAQGGTLVLTSHHWDEIEAICDSIAFIDAGETVLSGTIETMRAHARVNRISFSLPKDTSAPTWTQAEQVNGMWHVESAQSDDVLRRMIDGGVPFSGLTVHPLPLRDVIERIRLANAAFPEARFKETRA